MDRPAFGVHMDVCNGINSPTAILRERQVHRRVFRKLGPWIASCHAKDLEWKVELNVHFLEVVPGRGQIDYEAISTALHPCGRSPLMLEHLKTAEEYEEGKQYIKRVGASIGVDFA